jgi:two-component system response regulator AtoC
MSARILVVDDDVSIRETFEQHLAQSGFEVRCVGSAEEALALLPAFDPALVITDLRLPGADGLELLSRIKAGPEEVEVVLITAHDDMKSAVAAMKAGAYDYLVKPLDLDQIDLAVRRSLRERALRGRMRRLTDTAAKPFALDRLVGRDPRMIEIYKLIGVLTGTRATVLIRGETGSGKEGIARAIHYNSPMAAEPFIAVNCTALSESLLESELFGHVRGAFTGAVASRQGCFELAGAGTILLDEIGDTSLALQAKLLRVLETREFYPVGGERVHRTEARLVAATHRPLEELIRSGRFREDLYFRLNVVQVTVPPLRERVRDIPLLVEHLLERIARELHRDVREVTDEAVRLLCAYPWPGNVRELENTLTRAAVLARGPVIGAEHLSLGAGLFGAGAVESGTAPDETLTAVVRTHVQRVLNGAGGNKRRAARILGISRPRLDRILAGDRSASERG